MKFSMSVKLTILIVMAIFSGFGIVLSSSYGDSSLSIFLVAAVPILSIIFSGCDPVDPRVWFPIFGGLYSLSFFVLHLFGIVHANAFGVGVFLGHIFLASTVISMWLVAALKPKQPLSFSTSSVNAEFPELFTNFCVVVFIGSWLYVASDATLASQVNAEGKRALKALDVGLPAADTVLNWSLFVYVVLLWKVWGGARRRTWLIAFVGILVAYYWLATGERDAVLKWFMVTAFIALYNKSVSLRFVYAAGIVTLVLLPVMKDLGVLMGSGEVDLRRTQDLFVWILRLEWRGAGENFDILLRSEQLYAGKGMERFAADIVRGILPGQLATDGTNTSGWYYQEYTPIVIGRTSNGLGFSYAGAWYIFAGTMGVALGGIIFGVVCWLFFLASRKGVLINSAYLVFVPMAIWTLRGDLSSFLSVLTKQSLYPAAIFAVALAVMKARSYRRSFAGIEVLKESY